MLLQLVSHLEHKTYLAVGLYNDGPSKAYIGPSGVTVTNGYILPTGVEKAFAIAANYDIWAVTSGSQTTNIRVLEIA